jgi:nucleotide-binding universal stress UspA family protein
MFKKIVVPLDLTDRHQPALDIAAELTRQCGGAVTLLHVIEVIPGLSMEEEKSFYNRLERAARSHLKRIADVLAQRQITCRQEILYGNRAREITRYGVKTGADLIVLTAPWIEPDNPTGWGSLSYKVGILARCPVLLVKGQEL